MPSTVPARALHRLIGRIRTIAVAALLCLPACVTPSEHDCPGVDCLAPDGGIMSPDGGPGAASDGGPSNDDAGLEPTPDPEFQASADACFNGLDDDGDLAPDCEEASCGVVPYCCVGVGRTGCCVGPGTSVSVGFASCSGPDPRDCGAGLQSFGSPAPTRDGRGFVPNGSEATDAGLVLGPALDLRRESVTLSATIASSSELCTGPGCIDVVALGVGDPPGALPNVRPLVGVYVRRSRGDVALVVAGDVVDTRDIIDDQPRNYTLELTPDGRAILTVQGESTPLVGRYGPRAGVRPLLWGRTFEIGGSEQPTAAALVSVTSRGCDIPDSLARDAAPALPFGGAPFSGDVQSPSAVADGEETLLAFVYQDAIHLARFDGSSWTLAGSGDLGSPVVTAGVNERFADPQLVRRADRYDLYLTRVASDGGTSIVMARGGTGFAETFSMPEPVATPPSLRSPAVLDRDGEILLAAVTELDAGPVIVLLRGADPVGPFEPIEETLEQSVIASTGEGLGHFAMDEVSDPTLFVGSRGLLRLYYAGRLGTRWSVGARVSGGVLDTWRDPVEGESIAAGSGFGYDALSLRDPTVVLMGDDLHLYTTSTDGVFRSIGHAVGRAP